MLDTFNQVIAGTYQELNGIRYTELDYGRAVGEFTIDSCHLNPNGYLHGAALVALADSVAMAGLIYSYDFTPATTTSLSISFIRSAQKGIVRAEARILSQGKTASAWQVECFDYENNLLAVVQVNFCILKKGLMKWEKQLMNSSEGDLL